MRIRLFRGTLIRLKAADLPIRERDFKLLALPDKVAQKLVIAEGRPARCAQIKLRASDLNPRGRFRP